MKRSELRNRSLLLHTAMLGFTGGVHTRLPTTDTLAVINPHLYLASHTSFTEQRIIAAYRGGRPLRKIAKEFGTDKQKIIDFLKRVGVWKNG